MKITTITPAYKAEDFLERCITSIQKQSLQPDEIMIGIDACEKTLKKAQKLAKQDNRIRVFYFPEHAGPYRIRNTMAMMAKGDMLVLFDADDVMYKDYIKKTTKIAKKSVFCRPCFFNFTKDGKRHKSSMPAEGCISIMKADVVKNAGWEPWVCAADSEFRYRVERRGMTWIQTEKPVFDRYVHDGNITSLPSTNISSPCRTEYKRIIQERKRTKYTKDIIAVAPYMEVPPGFVLEKENAWQKAKLSDVALIVDVPTKEKEIAVWKKNRKKWLSLCPGLLILETDKQEKVVKESKQRNILVASFGFSPNKRVVDSIMIGITTDYENKMKIKINVIPKTKQRRKND